MCCSFISETLFLAVYVTFQCLFFIEDGELRFAYGIFIPFDFISVSKDEKSLQRSDINISEEMRRGERSTIDQNFCAVESFLSSVHRFQAVSVI
jgi:hypothetical protein